MTDDDKDERAFSEPAPPAKMQLAQWVVKLLPSVLLVVLILKTTGVITPDQADKFEKAINEIAAVEQEKKEELKPTPVPEPTPQPPSLDELIRKAVEEAMKKREPVPTPAGDDVAPVPTPPAPIPPPQAIKIRVCDESGNDLATNEVEAGQLFRVSALGVGESIGWHSVKSGDVRLSASTDGKEFCGYLDAGQWVEFSLTDFASKTQVALRVTCLTAPQPPPPDPRPEPDVQPRAKNVRLFVIYNPDRITPDAAIVLNANDMWDGFTRSGNDWKFIDLSTEDSDEKKIVSDASGTGLPAIVVYDKVTGKKLAAEELPKSVIATEGFVERFTGVR